MLYHLFEYLQSNFDLMGAGVFRYISFRAGMAMLLSLVISVIFGRSIISFLRKKQLGESIRDLGLDGQMQKKGTPTMGGIIIMAAITIPTLLFARIENVYVLLLLLAVIGFGGIGWVDDYLKIKKKNKEGLSGRFKIIGQVSIGLIVGLVMVFNEDVVVREFISVKSTLMDEVVAHDIKGLITNIPFVKDNQFDYAWLVPAALGDLTWIIYVFIVVLIITSVSNGANITDGIDGLAAGTSAIIGLTLAVFAYLSGNAVFANYLNIMFIPHAGELVIFCAAFVGACIGFLWYNSYPAQVFMGDTGSLSLGGVIAVLAIVLRKELLIPFLCGIFVIENLSVIIQVAYFKYTKKKFGEGKRIFKMAPLHHHYQKLGMHETKIVTRFWIIGILLSIFTLATLKLR